MHKPLYRIVLSLNRRDASINYLSKFGRTDDQHAANVIDNEEEATTLRYELSQQGVSGANYHVEVLTEHGWALLAIDNAINTLIDM